MARRLVEFRVERRVRPDRARLACGTAIWRDRAIARRGSARSRPGRQSGELTGGTATAPEFGMTEGDAQALPVRRWRHSNLVLSQARSQFFRTRLAAVREMVLVFPAPCWAMLLVPGAWTHSAG
jgi:hypothetical protein